MVHSFTSFQDLTHFSLEPFNEILLINSNFQEEGLTIEEVKVLLIMTQSAPGINSVKTTYSFQGLRRACNLHQARLTKALNRLITKRAIIKTPHGYELTDLGVELANKFRQEILSNKDVEEKDHKYVAFLKTKLTNGNIDKTKLPEIYERLLGKWFANLRFYSVSYNENFLQFNWVGDIPPTVTATLSILPPNKITGYIVAKNEEQLESTVNVFVQRISQELGATGINIEFTQPIFDYQNGMDVLAS